MPKEDEQVLVVKQEVIAKIGMFQGLNFDVQPHLRELFLPGVPRFKFRSQVEKDPSYKQLIPYVIIACNGKYLNYVRGKRAGEKRLVGHGPIGIGGHINPIDHEIPLFGWLTSYLAAVEREVAEEISIEANHTDRIVALINDDSSEVGSVHLGIVHFWNLDSPNVSKIEQMITQMTFMTADELQNIRDTLETWSSLCLDNLAEMEKAKGSDMPLDSLSEGV